MGTPARKRRGQNPRSRLRHQRRARNKAPRRATKRASCGSCQYPAFRSMPDVHAHVTKASRSAMSYTAGRVRGSTPKDPPVDCSSTSFVKLRVHEHAASTIRKPRDQFDPVRGSTPKYPPVASYSTRSSIIMFWVSEYGPSNSCENLAPVDCSSTSFVKPRATAQKQSAKHLGR